MEATGTARAGDAGRSSIGSPAASPCTACTFGNDGTSLLSVVPAGAVSGDGDPAGFYSTRFAKPAVHWRIEPDGAACSHQQGRGGHGGEGAFYIATPPGTAPDRAARWDVVLDLHPGWLLQLCAESHGLLMTSSVISRTSARVDPTTSTMTIGFGWSW
jgi:hypothetical protein